MKGQPSLRDNTGALLYDAQKTCWSLYSGLISFGTHVHVHELQDSPLTRVSVFRGSGDYSPSAVATQLGFHAAVRRDFAEKSTLAKKFLVSLQHAEYQVEAAIDSLQVRLSS